MLAESTKSGQEHHTFEKHTRAAPKRSTQRTGALQRLNWDAVTSPVGTRLAAGAASAQNDGAILAAVGTGRWRSRADDLAATSARWPSMPVSRSSATTSEAVWRPRREQFLPLRSHVVSPNFCGRSGVVQASLSMTAGGVSSEAVKKQFWRPIAFRKVAR